MNSCPISSIGKAFIQIFRNVRTLAMMLTIPIMQLFLLENLTFYGGVYGRADKACITRTLGLAGLSGNHLRVIVERGKKGDCEN